MKNLSRYFFQGLVIVAPVAVTAFLFYQVFVIIDAPIGRMIERITGMAIPGIGFLVMVVLAVPMLIAVGFLSGNILLQGVMGLMSRQVERLPLVKLIYSSLKDLINAFVGDKKRFDQPVAVTLMPGSGVRVLGFVTSKDMAHMGLEGQVAVYLPQSYNFAGNLIVVPQDRVEPLSVPSGEMMTFIVSGGIARSGKTEDQQAGC